jgi:hypothetical protein
MGIVPRRTLARYGAVLFAGLAYYAMTGYESGVFSQWSQLQTNVAAFALAFTSGAVVIGGLDWQLRWSRAHDHVPDRTVAGYSPVWGVWLWGSSFLVCGIAVGVVAAAIGLGPVVVGDVDPLFLAVAVLVVVPFHALGVVLGRFSRSKLVPLIGGVMTYGLLAVVMYSGGASRQLAPIADGTPGLGTSYAREFLWLQLGWLCAAGLAVMVVGFRSMLRMHPLAVAGVAAVACALAVGTHTTEAIATTTVELACAGTGPEVCGPEELAFLFDDVRGAATIFAGYTGSSPNRVVVGETRAAPSGGEVVIEIGQLQLDPTMATTSALVDQVIFAACPDEVFGIGLILGEAMVVVSEGRPIGEVGDVAGAASRLQRDPDWVRNDLARLQSCDVSIEDLRGG